MTGEAFRSRLRRLRREGEPPACDAAPGGPTEGGELPRWLRERLDRDRLDRERRPPAAAGSLDEPGGLEPIVLDGVPATARARTTRFAPGHRHGAWPLAAVDGASAATLALVARDPAVASLDPRRAVYLDIETTGLSGGSGTYPYLVALGRFAGDGDFVLWQGFMRGPEEERELLRAVAERVAAAGQLVTFFGKSFDRHRLEDKMRLHGVAAPFADAVHLDLYYPCRRLYGEALADGRLQTMERALCGFERVDDLPGSMAPAAWFDFVAGRPHRLEEVFRHNLDDVLSLVALTAHLGRVGDERGPAGAPLAGCDLTRARGLARLFDGARDAERALLWIDRALERLAARRASTAAEVHEAARREHLLWRAELLERGGDRAGALATCEALAEDADDGVAARALARAAKLLEHHARDRPAALAACDRALPLIERTLSGSQRARVLADVSKRRARLALAAAPAPGASAGKGRGLRSNALPASGES